MLGGGAKVSVSFLQQLQSVLYCHLQHTHTQRHSQRYHTPCCLPQASTHTQIIKTQTHTHTLLSPQYQVAGYGTLRFISSRNMCVCVCVCSVCLLLMIRGYPALVWQDPFYLKQETDTKWLPTTLSLFVFLRTHRNPVGVPNAGSLKSRHKMSTGNSFLVFL